MKRNSIKEFSLSRLRARVDVPSIGDDLLLFEDLKMMPQIQDPRRMNCLIVGVCTGGNATYILDEKRYGIKGGDCLILSEGQVINEVTISDDCTGIAILISYKFLYEIVKGAHNLSTLFLLARRHPVFPLTEDEISTAMEYQSLIFKRVNAGEYPFRKDVVRMLILTMIYDLGAAFYRILNMTGSETPGYTTRGEQIFIMYLQLVEHHFKEERRVGWYADKIGITAKYLSETVSSISKKTPNEWIELYVTTEIRNQLRQTNKKISEIAKYLNFPNQSFLGKYFKENVGMSPSEYRKSTLE